MKDLEKITKACQVVNPEMVTRTWLDDVVQYREPQLADVCLALGAKFKNKRKTIEMTMFGMFIGTVYDWENEPILWNLYKPLHEQTPETLSFIASLL